ncbi:hypothetical protein EMPS_02574 [Entomortierella parvispora]|uniref:Uncharacterized protein n=1 Tax=Entomortierella parvispora TaxID=205924 RepID=A0A9P3LU22_9FUNG|nr:hypothetical protein EMPS_02574 [Entomortierella parvispora]
MWNQNNRIPYRSSRWPGRLLMLTGIGHNIVGLIRSVFREPFIQALNAGYLNKFDYSHRGNSFWFLLTGFNLFLIGRLVDWYLFPIEDKVQKKTQSSAAAVPDARVRSRRALPQELTYWCLGLGIGGGLAFPMSGFHLMTIQGLLLLLLK